MEEREKPEVCEVLIIGAGISGLAAARMLENNGCKTVILEAQNRIGGRIQTDLSLGVPLDLGAGWIHGKGKNPLHRLAKEFGLRRFETDYENITRFDEDGRKLTDTENRRLEKQMAAFYKLISKWQDEFEEDMSLFEALNRYLYSVNASSVERREASYLLNTVIEHEYAAALEELSLYWFDSAGQYKGGDSMLTEGYEQLTNALGEGLDIRLEHQVDEICWGGKNVAEPVLVKAKNLEFSAKKVLVSIPLGVLKSGSPVFNPPLPRKKQKAIDRMGFGLLNKVYLRFREVFWDEDTQLIGYISEGSGQWCEWYNMLPVSGEPILLGMNAGDYAKEMEGMTDEQIVNAATGVLRTLYGSEVPDPVDWRITRWGQNPYAHGSYSSLSPGLKPKAYKQLARPLGKRVYFAGEHTHKKHPATAHGAYKSGQRAAREILLDI
ncbi:MAG: FAD-dependent oxidoreductase [Balneolales bacterium]|nr:FAD-dependent oxidoreductase [Balneolales bacterium]